METVLTQEEIDIINDRNEQSWKERIKDERFERRMQTTVWAVRKTVKWAVIGAAGAFVYAKITKDDDATEENNEG